MNIEGGKGGLESSSHLSVMYSVRQASINGYFAPFSDGYLARYKLNLAIGYSQTTIVFVIP